MSTISEENKAAVLNDSHQNIVRPNWTKRKIETLQDLVLEQKEGVLRANFQVDWDQISRELEDRFKTIDDDDHYPPVVQGQESFSSAPSSSSSALLADKLKATNAVPVPPAPRQFSAAQCRTCWEFISAQPARARFLASSNKGIRDVDASDRLEHQEDNNNSMADSKKSHLVKEDDNWTDLEVVLLKQGVRRHGTKWADVRAQFLPQRDVSDLYQKWKTISVAPASTSSSSSSSLSSPLSASTVGSGTTTSSSNEDSSPWHSSSGKSASEAVIDRLSDPDYVGLLSALDKVVGAIDEKEKKSLK
jgi:hypothetical protein